LKLCNYESTHSLKNWRNTPPSSIKFWREVWAGFEPATPSLPSSRNLQRVPRTSSNLDWDDFLEWCLGRFRSEKHAKCMYYYAKRHHHMLFDFREASKLHTFTKSKRHNVMLALNALAKYLGCLDLFKAMKEGVGLKWDSYDSFDSFLSSYSSSRSDVLEWVKALRNRLNWKYYFPVAFMALTGLRVSEACTSITVVYERGVESYYNRKTSCLEHFRFKSLFMRGKKNAFATPVSHKVVELLEGYGGPVTRDTLRCKLRREDIGIRMHELRSCWATYLR